MHNIIARSLTCLFMLVNLTGHASMAAALATESGVFLENFSTYQSKDFTQTAVWDRWNQQVRLQRSAIDQYMPAVAAAPDGGVYAASKQENGVYVVRLDTSGSQVWPSATQLINTAPNPYVSMQNQVAIAALPQGGVIVVWASWQILAQRVSADGDLVWSEPLVVSNQSDGWATPSVSIYADGSYLVVWGDNGVKALRISTNGTFLWPAPVAVALSGGEQRFPDAALDDAGNAVIAWYRSGSVAGDIYAQSIDPNGGQRWTGGDVRVNAEADVVNIDYDGTLDLDAAPDGSTVVAWTSIYNYSRRIASAQRLGSSGARLWGQDVRISGYNDTIEFEYLETTYPVVSMDPSGGALISFLADTPIERIQLHAMYITSDGQRSWLEDTTLTINQPVVAFTPHTNTITTSGDVWVGWYQGSSQYHPYAHKIDLAGNLLLHNPVPLIDDTGLSSQTNPVLASGPDGGAFVAWEDNRRGMVDVYITRRTSDGSPAWQTDIRVNGDDPQARANSFPRIAVDPDGNALVTYIRAYANEFQLFAQKLDANGNKLWPAEIAITDRRNSFSNSMEIAAGTDGTFVMTWLEYRTQIDNSGISDVVAQKISPEGQPMWSAGGITVNDPTPLLSDVHPSVLIDGTNHSYIFWGTGTVTFVGVPEDWAVYAQRLSPEGVRQWASDVKLSTDAAEPQTWFPPLAGALFSDSSLYVSWQTNGPFNHYGQRILPDGTLAWAEPQTTGNLAPVHAGSAPDGSVYLTGIRHLDDPAELIKVNNSGQVTTLGQTFPTPPHLSYWTSGPVVAAYTTTGQGPDVEVTSIEPAPGGSSWSVAALAAPENFYLEQGVVRSLAVDSFTENIARATLTAGVELNGGEIVFSLSNNGGNTWQTALPGIAVTFPSPGSDLRWQAEITRDPVWPRRSPLITSVRIEYDAEESSADRYEVDDACEQATAIDLQGAAQGHTLHNNSDVDWVMFETEPGRTYVIQAAEAGINADVLLQLFDQCSTATPLVEMDDPFNGNAQIAYTASGSGLVYAAVKNQGTGWLYNAYQLSVRVQENAPVVVIVASGSPDAGIQQALQVSADKAYRLFLKTSPREDIRYMAPDTNRDVDGNGSQDDIFASANHALLRDTIQDWARERGAGLGKPFYLFILADGQPGHLISHLDGGSVNPATLSLWLENLESTSGADRVSVILEAPYAGDFLTGTPSIAGPKRVIITAASDEQLAYLSEDGAFFTNALLDGLEQRLSLRDAFRLAERTVAASGLPQTPWLDDNGDGQPDLELSPTSLKLSSGPDNSTSPDLPDGLSAAARGLNLATSARPPVADQIIVTRQEDNTFRLSVRVRGVNTIEQVSMLAFPFGYQPETVLVEGAKINLLPTGDANIYSVDELTADLHNHFLVTAVDDKGISSVPVSGDIRFQIQLPMIRRR